MVSQMLDYVCRMLDKDEKEKLYDVYSVLGISTKEVIMCRFICDIIDPHGKHKKADKYLREFLKLVLKIPPNELDEYLDGAKVYKEYPIHDKYLGKDRRIDLVICNAKHFIPIEVKIYAEEQEAQCLVYYDYAKEQDKDAKIYYLTIHGTPPSDYSQKLSRKGLDLRVDLDDLVCISFARDILSWLRYIADNEDDLLMRQNISQYMYAVKNFAGRFDVVERSRIIDELLSDKDKLIAGIEISNTIDDAKAKVMENMFTALEREMAGLTSEYHLDKLGKVSFVSWENLVGNYYKASSVYPGINYHLKDIVISTGVDVWLRIEIFNNLFVGFCVTRNGEQLNVKDVDKADLDKISATLSIKPMMNESWWLTYEYLPSGGSSASDETPDFRRFNDAAIALSDSETLNRFCGKSVETIRRNLLEKIRR